MLYLFSSAAPTRLVNIAAGFGTGSIPSLHKPNVYEWTDASCDTGSSMPIHSTVDQLFVFLCQAAKNKPALGVFNGTKTLSPVLTDVSYQQPKYGSGIGVALRGGSDGPFLVLQGPTPETIGKKHLLTGISLREGSLGVSAGTSRIYITDEFDLPSGSDDAGISVGAMVGITVGVLVALVIVGYTFGVRQRLRARTKVQRHDDRARNNEIHMKVEAGEDDNGSGKVDTIGEGDNDNHKVEECENDDDEAVGPDEPSQIEQRSVASRADGAEPQAQTTILQSTTDSSPPVRVLFSGPASAVDFYPVNAHDNTAPKEWVPRPFDPRLFNQTHAPALAGANFAAAFSSRVIAEPSAPPQESQEDAEPK
ncbi:hypothetical protein DFQ27_000555 [Actinomortierella ambigua]|uniref:Uncharacterized protein n=1 Tax=Actinomortierella ambigua TaxID=1343610 RepID=A0A9P6U9K8_9FUNG|nr:hypothetical protein DFQ27_000555 [Actinomortierella ambigua]